jgi:alpha-mannosidase
VKIFLVIALFAALNPLARAESNVQKVARTLDSLSLVSFNNWKASPDLKSYKPDGDPSKPDFDDSKWDNLALNASIYPDSCWLRKTITVPKTYLGQPIAGSLRFLVSVDDYGYLWVNGESKGHFPWDGDFELTKNASAGQKFTLAIKAINTGGPLRLLRAELRLEKVSELLKTIQGFGLSLRVGEKLLSFDTYQTNARKKEDPGIDKSPMSRDEKTRLNLLLQDVAGKLDVDALAGGKMEKFMASLSSTRTELKPVREFAKRFTLYFDANAHIDAAWLWRDKETIEVCKNTFSSVFNMMDARPEFTYTQSAAAYYDWMERLYPDVFKGIQKRVADGRWEVVGGMWVEPDCNLPGGISWARHLLYAKNYFRKKFGVDVKIGWNPDSFGYNGNMPMFYTDAGIDAFVTQKIGWNDTNVFPYRVFWWQSPDSSRILTYFPYDYVNTIDDPYALVDWMRQFEANTGFSKMMILFGVGDHGGGPSIEMLDRIKALDSLDIYPTLQYGTMTTYLDWMKKQDLSKVPVWTDELYLEYHQGTYTTQAKMKEENRRCETLLGNAETFCSIAGLYGKPYAPAKLEEAWRNVLFNQFHDILPGSGIRENYIDANEKYARAKELGNGELRKSLERIEGEVNTSEVKKGTPLLVFNPCSDARTDLVTLPLSEDDSSFAVFDERGKEIPSQISFDGHSAKTLLFVAPNVPPVGYAVYELRGSAPASAAAPATPAPPSIENSRYKVVFDADSGWISALLDKKNSRELLSGPGNELQILEDKPSAWDAWNIGLTGVKYPSKLRSIRVVEHGPVRTVIRVTRDYLKPGVTKDFPTEDFPSSFFTQDVALYEGIDRIDFTTNVDWWEDKTMLKVAFPLTVNDTVATYEIPFGTIRRSTRMRDSWEKAKVEVPAERWADLSQDDYGVSLLNRSKYGYDIKGATMRLSLLRSPKWPDPTADRGKHVIEYAILPHSGRLDPASATREAEAYNNPLIALRAKAHRGKLPRTKSFITVEPPSLVLSSVKKGEDGASWIVQLYDAAGTGATGTLTLPADVRKASYSNFLEEDGAPITPVKNTVTLRSKKHAVTTLKIVF